MSSLAHISALQYQPEDDQMFKNRNFLERDEYNKIVDDRIKKGLPPIADQAFRQPPSDGNNLQMMIEEGDENLFLQSTGKNKYTPLRANRSPHPKTSAQHPRKTKHQKQSLNRSVSFSPKSAKKHFGRNKPDFNYNYKKTFHKNVLLKEWQYLPLYERQLLWSKQKERKQQELKNDKEFSELKEHTF